MKSIQIPDYSTKITDAWKLDLVNKAGNYWLVNLNSSALSSPSSFSW